MHDLVRLGRRGQPSHARAERGLRLLQAAGLEPTVLAVLTETGLADPDGFYDYFAELGVRRVGLNVEDATATHLSSLVALGDAPDAYAAFLTRIVSRAREHGEAAVSFREITQITPALLGAASTGLPPSPDVQNPLRIVSYDTAGNFGTFCPELMTSENETKSRFVLGNVVGTSLADASASVALRENLRLIEDGIAACSRPVVAGRERRRGPRQARSGGGRRARRRHQAQDDDFVAAVYGNAPWVALIVAAVTFGLLARALRSMVLPVKALALNVLSVGAAFGVTALIWQHGVGTWFLFDQAASGAVTVWVPVAVFAFLFGLSMDYEVFLLARIREAHDRGASTDDATVLGVSRTGRLVSSAALILFLAFVSLSRVPSTDVRILATGLATGIVIDATIVRGILAPALVAGLGSANWWVPGRHRGRTSATAGRRPRSIPRPPRSEPRRTPDRSSSQTDDRLDPLE